MLQNKINEAAIINSMLCVINYLLSTWLLEVRSTTLSCLKTRGENLEISCSIDNGCTY